MALFYESECVCQMQFILNKKNNCGYSVIIRKIQETEHTLFITGSGLQHFCTRNILQTPVMRHFPEVINPEVITQ